MDGIGGGRTGFTYHGGDLAAARAAFPDAPEPWLDLSTGINAVPYPIGPIPLAAWTALPARADVARLEAAAARAYGARPEEVVAASGTQALIGWLPHLAAARRVGILGVTYAEHARTWREAGAEVETVEEIGALAGFEVAVVVNPNNPDGRLTAPADLARLAERVGLLVVDEAFMDVMPDGWSLAPALPANAVVLRSFGKAFGLAGLRLGFAVTPSRSAALRRALGPWAVSGAAVAIGIEALADRAWLDAARRRLVHDAARLDRCLEAMDARVVGGTPLFRLADVGDASRWFEALAQAGILVRPFEQRPRWLRFGVPAGEPQWQRLESALARSEHARDR